MLNDMQAPMQRLTRDGLAKLRREGTTDAFVINEVVNEKNDGRHWFAVRQFGGRYYELDSQSQTPALITSNILDYLGRIMQNGNNVVFLVREGDLPPVCDTWDEMRTRQELEREEQFPHGVWFWRDQESDGFTTEKIQI